MSCSRIGLLFVLLLCSTFAVSAGIQVVYPANESESDQRFNDLHEILQAALEKTIPEYGPYELKPSARVMTEARYLAELRDGKLVNVAWSSTSNEKEAELLPLRIPLRKGILGYRIALIAKDNQAKIDEVKTLTELRKLSIGQGIGWGDVTLYLHNGINVYTSNYDLLFKMVSAGRFDLFPRGISEIFSEFNIYSKDNPNLAIEKNLLIYYPWPYYFFFNKKDAALMKRVDVGIHIMMHDGSFDAIFRKYNNKAIEQANLKGRRVIKIENNLLPKETPLDDTSLWFDPAKY